jgi:tetratricopeptide (TPR) repeat protein
MAFMGSGRIVEWLDLGKEAERRANTIDDIERKVAAMTVRSAAQNFYSTPIDAIATGEQVVRLAEGWGNPGWLSLAQYGLGQAYYIAGRYREAEQMLGRACEQLMGPKASAPIGTTPQYLLLMCSMMQSICHTALGEIEAADLAHRRAQEIADESNRPFDRVAAAYSGGNLMLSQGNPAAAAVIFDEAFALAQEHGVRLFVPVSACYRGMAYLAQGRIDEALEVLAWSREAAGSVDYKSIELRASIHLALALHLAGDVRAALNILRDTRNTARQQGFAGLEAEALLSEAMVTPVANEDDRAAIIRCLQASIAIATENEARPLRLKAETLLGQILADPDDAEPFPWDGVRRT